MIEPEPIHVAKSVPTSTGALSLRPATMKSVWVLTTREA